VFRSLSLSERGFGLDTEITAELLRHGLRPYEVPVSYSGRSRAEGKQLTWRDGGRCLCYGMASGQFAPIAADVAAARDITVHRGAPVTPERMRELSRAALAAAAAGQLRPLIGQVYPLAEAAAAHAAIEGRQTTGKTLLATAAATQG